MLTIESGRRADELLLTKEALTSAQQALKASCHELSLTKSDLAELRGELGSTKSQVESMRREMLLHKRCAPRVGWAPSADLPQLQKLPRQRAAMHCELGYALGFSTSARR